MFHVSFFTSQPLWINRCLLLTTERCVKIWAATVWIYPHGFILPKSDTISTAFDFLVIFCSFCVYSLVPGVWHQCFSQASFLIKRATSRRPSLCDVMFFLLAIENYFIQFLIQVLRSCYICILSNCDKLCNQFRFTKFDTFRHYSNFCSHFVNGTWPPGAPGAL